MNEKPTEIKELIEQQYKLGKIVVSTIEGLQVMNMAEFLEQHIDGILYDLNRSEEVVLTFLPDPKWINDFAVCKVIRALKNKIHELENPKQ